MKSFFFLLYPRINVTLLREHFLNVYPNEVLRPQEYLFLPLSTYFPFIVVAGKFRQPSWMRDNDGLIYDFINIGKFLAHPRSIDLKYFLGISFLFSSPSLLGSFFFSLHFEILGNTLGKWECLMKITALDRISVGKKKKKKKIVDCSNVMRNFISKFFRFKVPSNGLAVDYY